MHSSDYKTLKVSRGLTYSYYFSKSNGSKPTMLFLHGFPSSSYEWRHQVAFFKAQGYGIVVPDMLGYGGTDKALDTALYTMTGLCRDILDVLDEEKLVAGVVCVSHDWGSSVASRLANSHNERFTGFAFVSLGYVAPEPDFDINASLAMTKKEFGYELFGYWLFFSSDHAAALIEAHWESFFSLLFTADPDLWRTDFAPTGAFEKWLTEDRKSEVATYLSDEEHNTQLNLLKKNGIKAALNWYKIKISIGPEDDKSVPVEKYTVNKPVIFFAAKHDAICIPSVMQKSTTDFCTNATVHLLDTDHWAQLQAADEMNVKLEDWLKKLY